MPTPLPLTPEYLAHLLREDVSSLLACQLDAADLAEYSASLVGLIDAVELSLTEIRRAAVAIVNQQLVG